MTTCSTTRHSTPRSFDYVGHWPDQAVQANPGVEHVDPQVTLVQWGNGPPPSTPPTTGACPAPATLPEGVAWSRETGYPVHHVFFYNPDVRRFVVGTLAGRDPGPQTSVTRPELTRLFRFLEGLE